MKRDPALEPLSRDHHKALFAAQRLRRGDPGGAAAHFLEFWSEHGRLHFRIEEDILFPAWAVAAETGYEAAMVMRALADHHEVRLAARRIAQGRAGPDELRALGERLDDHVRFEEREMFPAIEASLTQADLAGLAAEIEVAETGGGEAGPA